MCARILAALIAVIGSPTALFAQVAAQPAAASPSAAIRLLEPTDAPLAVAIQPEAVEVWPVAADLGRLVEAVPGREIGLELAVGISLSLRVEQSDRRGDRSQSIAGVLTETPNSYVRIVRHEDVVVGVIRNYDTGELYQLRYGGNGVHAVCRIDPTAYPPEACATLDIAPPEAPQPRGVKAESEFAPDSEIPDGSEDSSEVESAGGLRSAACAQPGPVFDVLIAYTNLARDAMGGDAASVAQAQLAVDVTNDTYVNSQINARLRLVHVMPVTYNEPGDQDEWASWVSFSFDPEALAVRAARDTYAADFVSMLCAGGSGFAWCTQNQSRAFSVAKWTRAVNTWTLAHEIGHNQGCDHNREDAADGCHSHGYSYGHYFNGNSGTQYGTVMSYEGERIPYFSNPNILFDGQPTGVPIGQSGEAHNAQEVNNSISFAVNYRLTRYDVWLDFDYFSVNYLGSFSQPYNNLAVAVGEVQSSPHASELPTLHIKAGQANDTITISKPMRIESCDGTTRIGG